jgi:conjugal transfer pilus assembly protein TraF
MHYLSRYFSVFLAMSLCMAVSVRAQEDSGESGFYEKGREGFYWYQDEPPPNLEEYFKQPEPDGFSYADLWRLNPEKFAQVLKERQLVAIQQPNEGSVLRYLEAQDVAKRKSMAFAGVMGLVSQTHPEFTARNLTNMIEPAKNAYYKHKEQEISNTLSAGSDEFALIVFEQVGCHYCEAQRPIIERFQVAHGWTVKYLDINEYKSMADKYSIEMTPSVMMISRSTNNAIQISSGVVSLAELQQRIIRAVQYLTGKNKPEQWFNESGLSDPLKFINQEGRGGLR